MLTEREKRFARAAVRRKRLFLVLSTAGVVVGLGFAAFVAYRRTLDPEYPVGVRLVLVVLILLLARLNLRQYRYAAVLEKLTSSAPGGESPGKKTVPGR